MKFDVFKSLYIEAKEYSDMEMYVSERGWQDWMECYADANQIASVLTDIYTMSRGDVDDLCFVSGMQMKSLSKMVEVPYPTMQRWKSSGIPERDKMLIAFAILSNK